MVDFNSNENWPRQPAYDKGEAPKVTAEDIKNEILLINYVNAHVAALAGAGQGEILDDELKRVTLCLITLKNGAVIVGQSACAHIDNYDKIKGEAAAYNDAFRQCWGLMGFALRDRLGRMVSYQGNDGTTYDPDGGESFSQLKWDKEVKGLAPDLDIYFGADGFSKVAAESIGKVISVESVGDQIRATVKLNDLFSKAFLDDEFITPEEKRSVDFTPEPFTIKFDKEGLDEMTKAIEKSIFDSIAGGAAAARIPERLVRGQSLNEQIAKLSARSMLREEAQKVLGTNVSDAVLDMIEQAQKLHAAQESTKEKIKADVERNIRSSRKGFFRFTNTSEK